MPAGEGSGADKPVGKPQRTHKRNGDFAPGNGLGGRPKGSSLAAKIRNAFNAQVQKLGKFSTFEEWLAHKALAEEHTDKNGNVIDVGSLPHLTLAMQKGWPTPSEITVRQPEAVAAQMLEMIRAEREKLAKKQREDRAITVHQFRQIEPPKKNGTSG